MCNFLSAEFATGGSVTKGKNLFRNASFLQSTNQPIPDYWDLHHAAAVTFKDLHNQYLIANAVPSPVAHTKTLKIVNNAKEFYHAILLPRIFFQKLPEGNYTFSVYAKSDRNNAELHVYKVWGDQGIPTKKVLTKQWERYAVTFNVGHGAPNPPQPMMYFPSNATYYIAAPQLEYGSLATTFEPSPEDIIADSPTNGSTFSSVDEKLNRAGVLSARQKNSPISATFEYEYYTNDNSANLEIFSNYDSDLRVHVNCPYRVSSTGGNAFSVDTVLARFGSTQIPVPLSAFTVDKHTCTVTIYSKTIKKGTTAVVLNRLANSPNQVRVSSRRFLESNNTRHFIIGMQIGGRDNLPDWYFNDLVTHGINTLFFWAVQDGRGKYDLTRINNFLMKASSHRLKVVLGLPLMGGKDVDWRQKISDFKELIQNLKNNPTIIAWEPIDEPAANTWQDSELMEIYNGIKQTDPYRPVFINWAYDGVPATIGDQPRGTLKATDFYSIDYYPFAGQNRTMRTFNKISTKALETSRMFNKIPHFWIQLYGSMDAWREPTCDELNYMVYLNLLYGGMFSYWETKSNSSTNWSCVAEINRQAGVLANSLFLNPNAREMGLPKFQGNSALSVWEVGNKIYMIVLHNGANAETMTFDLSTFTSSRVVSVFSLFEHRVIAADGNYLRDVFSPYQSRVYIVTANK